ncbi:MAG: 23S rRNA (uracil(1939)-C(5))-methyltransferase RlmD [Chloroflexi bacterium]|nr:23S rRNA (uracil(1939)-C(5))-methyltransferase RlmD [Chloroflexota bacterium]
MDSKGKQDAGPPGNDHERIQSEMGEAPSERGAVIRLQLESMAHGGNAVGRHAGRVYFITGGIPGEEVEIEVTADKGRYVLGRVTQVVPRSDGSAVPERILQPRCPHFGICGGCQWQHITYEAQLRFKTAIVRDQLQRIGGVNDPPVHPIIGMQDPWFYRNHMQYRPTTNPPGRLGFLGVDDRTVIAIDRCYIQDQALQPIFEELDVDFPDLTQLSLRIGHAAGNSLPGGPNAVATQDTPDIMVILETEGDEAPGIEVDLPVSLVQELEDGTALTLVGAPYLEEMVGGYTYRISAPSFFQVNSQQAEVLLQQVRQYAQVGPEDVVADLYSGVGLFGLALASQAAEVILVETHPIAVDDAEANAAELDNVTLIEGDVAEALVQLPVKPTVVIVDPPRAGLEPGTLDEIVKLAARRIVYVSCDPATLARDAKRLLLQGYRLVGVQPVDMFPQTYHIECVALLELP